MISVGVASGARRAGALVFNQSKLFDRLFARLIGFRFVLGIFARLLGVLAHPGQQIDLWEFDLIDYFLIAFIALAVVAGILCMSWMNFVELVVNFAVKKLLNLFFI